MPTWQLSSHVPGIDDAATIQAANDCGAERPRIRATRSARPTTPVGANQAACREVPDVSAQADEFTGGDHRVRRQFVRRLADLRRDVVRGADLGGAARCHQRVRDVPEQRGDANGVGFVSPLLYSVASNPTAYAASFNDITAGNNDPYGTRAVPGDDRLRHGHGARLAAAHAPGAAPDSRTTSAATAAAGARPTVTNIAPNVGFTPLRRRA